METKKCLSCGEKITGRADKRFCCDQCRNVYNNKIRSDDDNYVRNVNNTLRKNRRILLEMNPTGKAKVHRNQLNAKGYNFSFFTNTYVNKDGKTYYFCYEHGYLPIEHDYYFLVKRMEAR